MNSMHAPSCPCCLDESTVRLGDLLDVDRFSGTSLASPLTGGSLYRCNHCHLKFRHPKLGSAVYDELYDNGGTKNWQTSEERPDWNLVTSYLSKERPLGSRVLDFGCYTGGLLAKLGPEFDRYGIEVNDAARAVASKHSGARVWRSLEEVPAGFHFDIIIATDVIEHMPNPAAVINKLASLLTEDGSLLITTGDANHWLWEKAGANWWYCYYPEHIAFVSIPWLRYFALTNPSLAVVHQETFRYRNLKSTRRVIDAVLTLCYARNPSLYRKIACSCRRALGQQGAFIPPGCGISRDHLFFVLRPSCMQ